MKKLIFLLAFILPVVFVSCGDEDDEPGVEAPAGSDKPEIPGESETPEENDSVETPKLELDKESVTVFRNNSFEIESTTTVNKWVSSNPFVAKVTMESERVCRVEARHIGETVITASNDSVSVECKVIVKPTNENFIIPILTWGASRDKVMEEMTKFTLPGLEGPSLSHESSTSILYTYSTSSDEYLFPYYIYIFDNGGLSSSSLTVNPNQKRNLQVFLEERYQEVGETENGWIYANGEEIATSTLLVQYEYDPEIDLVMAIWGEPRKCR